MKEHPLPRWPRFMVLDWAFSLPFLSAFMRKVGGVPASPLQRDPDPRARRADDGLPRGRRRGPASRSPSATGCSASAAAASSRSRCGPARRSSRSRSSAPRRSTRRSATAAPLARAIGAPFVPITPTFPWLGPLGPGPAAVEVADRVLRADRPLAVLGPRRPTTGSVVFELSEQVRETIQEKLYENLVKRGSAFV